MVPEGHNMRQGRHPTILLRATLGGHAIFVLPKGHATFVVYYLPVPGRLQGATHFCRTFHRINFAKWCRFLILKCIAPNSPSAMS
jgi:hypothetical protein